MEFLKRHYEKVLLSVVLLVLAVASVYLLLRVSTERTRLEEIKNMDVRVPKTELKPVDLTTNQAVLRRLRRPEPVQLTREHNLFNPVQWQRRPDGTLVKILTGNEVGAGALTITKIIPLRLIVSYEGSTTFGETPLYKFKVTREAERNPSKRRPITLQVADVGAKNEVFILKDMRPRNAPTEFVLEMNDSKAVITVSSNAPNEGVAGYMVDLRYEPDSRQQFLNKRVDERVVVGGDTNKIVSITASNVTLEAFSNKKRVTITATNAPAVTGSP